MANQGITLDVDGTQFKRCYYSPVAHHGVVFDKILIFSGYLLPLHWSQGGEMLWFFIFSESLSQSGSNDMWHIRFQANLFLPGC